MVKHVNTFMFNLLLYDHMSVVCISGGLSVYIYIRGELLERVSVIHGETPD